MEEMVYSDKRKAKILKHGKYLGFEFYIMNLGTHPTAYINIPKEHKFYGVEYEDLDELDIDVHGGLTYSKDTLIIDFDGENIQNAKEVKGWFIGWDYAHANDYTGFPLPSIFDFGSELFNNIDKKWTTEEIFEEVQSVCEQIKSKEEK